MIKHNTRFISLIYLPQYTRDKSHISTFLLIMALCLAFITPHVSAEQSANVDFEPVIILPTAIDVTEITEQAGKIEDHLQRLENDLFGANINEHATAELDKSQKEIKTMQTSIGKTLDSRIGDMEIQTLSSIWKIYKKRLTSQQTLFKKRAEKLSKEIDRLQEETQIWRLTRKDSQLKSVTMSLKKREEEILVLLSKSEVKAKKALNSTLDVLTRIAKLQDLVDDAIRRIEKTNSERVSNVLVAQDLPLWQYESYSKEIKSLPSNIVSRYKTLKTGLISFIKEHHALLLIQAIFTLILSWFLSRRYLQIRKEAKDESYGLDALKHPWSAAVLISLYMTPFVYVDRTMSFILMTTITSLPFWLYVVGGMLPAVLRMSLISVTLLILVEYIRTAFGGYILLSRWVLVLEFFAALATLRWLLRPENFQRIPSHLRINFWYKLMHTWMRYTVPVVGVGILAVIFGYSELAERIIRLVIWGPVAGASFIAIVRIIEAILQSYIHAGHFDFLKMIRVNRHPFVTLTRRVIRGLGFLAWVFLVLRAIHLLQPVHDVVYTILTTQLGVDPVKFSLGGILAFGFTLWFSWLLSRFVNLILDHAIFSRVPTPPGVPLAITTFSRYIILVVGFLAAVSVLGFPLDKITIVLGALGVGIGFGLQNITNNFVSGIILLFERPIRVGDKIQLDDLIGRVTSIGIRASKITSFEGSDVIVPNADFISSRVINWTFSDEKRRVILPVGVAHGSDPEQVLELLLTVAKDHPEIIDYPKPEALFQNFGESSLGFELRAWTESYRGWIPVRSDLAVRIHKALQEAKIEIPFPQRDVNFRNISKLQDALLGSIKK